MGEARRKYFSQHGVERATVVDEDKLHLAISQDVEPILDGIARDRETMRHGVNKLVARLPTIIVEDLIKREIYDEGPKFRKWLNSPEADPWRVWKGIV